MTEKKSGSIGCECVYYDATQSAYLVGHLTVDTSDWSVWPGGWSHLDMDVSPAIQPTITFTGATRSVNDVWQFIR